MLTRSIFLLMTAAACYSANGAPQLFVQKCGVYQGGDATGANRPANRNGYFSVLVRVNGRQYLAIASGANISSVALPEQ